MDKNKIYQGDCLEVLGGFPDECIDLTVTSPPYDNIRTYNGYSFDFEGIAKELFRVTKQGGVVVWVVGDATIKGSETGTSFRQALYFKEVGFNLHDTMIFQKSSPPIVPTVRRYQPNFEYMFVFSKSKLKTFNPLRVRKVYTDNRKVKKWHRKTNGDFVVGERKKTTDKIRENVWHYAVSGGNITKDVVNHPAMFPEKLAEDHILSWSNEKDIVLDPMCGSGTTLKMAMQNKRNYIGIEISKEYCEIARNRLTKHPLF